MFMWVFGVRSRAIHLTAYLKYIARMSSRLAQVPDVEIDSGRFKYVLIKVHDSPEGGEETSKMIVRGYNFADWHADVYDHTCAQVEKLGLDTECVGGGRILHDPDKKTIQVFGYSQGFGKADHSVSVDILKKKYPDYAKITWSDDGY
ncbi:14 kDa phosphohistidine phosphatase-like isoform X3 [Oratosquilla oratoria]|uniref:14 kDa phosphohistidine phosphatase-like isoform X3 n=1 Tax=Oratosquilla oratoria TaxID=337810 RepID=UPI003F7602B7